MARTMATATVIARRTAMVMVTTRVRTTVSAGSTFKVGCGSNF